MDIVKQKFGKDISYIFSKIQKSEIEVIAQALSLYRETQHKFSKIPGGISEKEKVSLYIAESLGEDLEVGK